MASDRVTKLTTGQYDQVIAITQYMMNMGLKNLFVEKGFTDPTKRKPMNVTTLGQGFKQLVLGPPQIIIETLDDNHTNLFYRMHLKSGKFHSQIDKRKDQNGDEIEPSPTDVQVVDYTINDWYYSFRVDLAQIVLKDDDPQKMDALKRLKRTVGKYTVQQLMVDMKTAKISVEYPEATDFGVWTKDDYNLNFDDEKINAERMKIGQKRDWEKEPDAVKVTFRYVISQVLKTLEAANLQNLGITAEAVDAGRISVLNPGLPPTFMPVDCRFQMYPWTDPNDPNHVEVNSYNGRGQLNYLLYLEMTGNKDGTTPVVQQEGRFLKELGNWTDGRTPGTDAPSKFGTFVLTKKKFLDEYLLPKFDKMNRMVKIDLSNLQADVHTDGFVARFARNIHIDIGAGFSTAPDPADANFRFVAGDNFKSMPGGDMIMKAMFPTTLSADALTWYWSFRDEPMRVHNTDRILNILYKCEHWGEADSSTITRLSIEPGKNQILFEGFSVSRLYWEKDWDIVPNGKAELHCVAKWSLKMTMREVGDGGLEFAIENSAPDLNFSGNNKGELSHFEDYMRNAYTTASRNFGHIVESLKDSLQNQERFVLPASGVYFFKNPIFNKLGDLLCELEWNGNADLEKVNKDAPARSPIGDTSLSKMPAGVEDPSTSTEKNENKGKGDK